MEWTKLKLEYLQELRRIVESDEFSNEARKAAFERMKKVCDSIDHDFGISS